MQYHSVRQWAVPTGSVQLFRQEVSVVQTGRAVYSDMVGLKNVACSDRRCRMFRNEECNFRAKKCCLLRQEVRNVQIGGIECSDRRYGMFKREERNVRE